MKRIRISGTEIVNDIRAGATDEQLVAKYGLSLRSLAKVKNALLERGSIVPEDLMLSQTSIPCRPSVSIAHFLHAFRSNPDDVYLMSEYSLSPQELDEVYQFLMVGGFLSEYEYNCRTSKASIEKPENAIASDDSTAIDLTDGRSVGIERDIRRFLDSCEWACDSVTQSRKGPGHTQNGGTNGGGNRVEELECGSCPKCRTPKSSKSPEACLHCGVVFTKYEQHLRKTRIAIWS
jgi:hypothetical protein